MPTANPSTSDKSGAHWQTMGIDGNARNFEVVHMIMHAKTMK
jgi:hypothetical protein